MFESDARMKKKIPWKLHKKNNEMHSTAYSHVFFTDDLLLTTYYYYCSRIGPENLKKAQRPKKSSNEMNQFHGSFPHFFSFSDATIISTFFDPIIKR